jgi:hypothetical protein
MGDLPGREHGVGSEVGRDARWTIRGPTLLIARLALAGKFIIVDVHDVTAGQFLGLAAVTLVLGTSYWLIGDFDERQV